MNTKNKQGSVLILTYLVVMVLLILGFSFVNRSIVESRIAERQKRGEQAFALAEAGLERALYRLRKDYENDLFAPSWTDGEIDGIDYTLDGGPDTNNFYPLSLGSAVLETGSYSVSLKNTTADDAIWVQSQGTVAEISKTIQAYVIIEDLAPWKNVIFAGVGLSGAVVNGNVDIRGSLLVLGTNLSSTDLAINVSGDGLIGNNYLGIPSAFSSRIPAIPTTIFNGEAVESLGAKLRIKRGKLGLSGSATVGGPDVVGNAYKETVDAVFITDGYGGSQGAESVYSDNGSGNPYDLGNSVQFPSLSAPHDDDPSITYQQFLRNNAYVIEDALELNEIANITPDSNFSYGDVLGSISMDGNGNMTINGVVYIDGGDLNMDKQGSDKTITYSGTGSILVTGNVGINVNLLTPAVANSYPANIMGIMTPQEITFNAPNIDVMGIFYAETKITAEKQTDIAGTIISNYFDMSDQVPSIFQVPATADSLPLGMIAAGKLWVVRVVAWQKL
ncbi:MAG: pilus assembly PilX N-terminal domain-containing protein [Omnitrophica bacterium]|nr:pilus assembly PilX N-terminal domain-containing protein [Candidatus Omnitrophota bacterium]